MDNPAYMTKSYTIRGIDGNDLTVSETAERQEVVISIQQNDEHGRIATVRLNAPQFESFCKTRYSLEVEEPKPAPPEIAEAA